MVLTEDDEDDKLSFNFVSAQGDGTTSRLCNRCQFVFDNWSQASFIPVFPHYEAVCELENAALSGCGLCYQLLKGRSSTPLRRLRRPRGLRKSTPSSRDDLQFLELSIELEPEAERMEESQEVDTEERVLCEMFEVTLIPTVYSAPIVQRSEHIQESTKDSLSLAARWLERCTKAHWKCTRSIGNSMPTRLIFIGHSSRRMCLSKEILSTVSYATLSHCWGENKFTTLLKDNFTLFQNRIPPEALSRTIQDAIQIAQHLGFQYLWIDTLCIIQDDPHDWIKESALMTSVYGHSGLNIAASGASNGGIGCFFEREQFWKCQVEAKTGASSQLYDVIPSDFPGKSLSTLPLLRRGWALQERLLASRTLHFTPTEIFWECHHKSASETFPEGFPTYFAECDDYLDKKPLDLSMWSWIVERYSRCQLTYERDKLVAISGIARFIQNQTQDQYIAGTWREDMAPQLCWFSETKRRKEGGHPEDISTWSSASAAGPVVLGTEPVLDPQISVLDVALQNPADPFGHKATLYVNCKTLLNIRIFPNPENWHQWALLELTNMLSPIVTIFDIEAPFNANEKRQGKLVYWMPLVQFRSDKYFSGLLLQPVEQQRGVYTRIGLANLSPEHYSGLMDINTDAHTLPVNPQDCWKVHRDKFGKMCHIIQLV